MGTTAGAFARNQRATNRNPRRFAGKGMKHQPKFALSESSEFLRDYSGKDPMEKFLQRLEATIKDKSTEKKAAKRLLTPFQLLRRVREWLPQVIADAQTGYIIMARTCNKLLRRVRAKISERQDYLYPLIDEGFLNDHGLLFMVASIVYQAGETQVAQEHSIRERYREQFHNQHSHLEAAGEILQEFMDNNAVGP